MKQPWSARVLGSAFLACLTVSNHAVFTNTSCMRRLASMPSSQLGAQIRTFIVENGEPGKGTSEFAAEPDEGTHPGAKEETLTPQPAVGEGAPMAVRTGPLTAKTKRINPASEAKVERSNAPHGLSDEEIFLSDWELYSRDVTDGVSEILAPQRDPPAGGGKGTAKTTTANSTLRVSSWERVRQQAAERRRKAHPDSSDGSRPLDADDGGVTGDGSVEAGTRPVITRRNRYGDRIFVEV